MSDTNCDLKESQCFNLPSNVGKSIFCIDLLFDASIVVAGEGQFPIMLVPILRIFSAAVIRSSYNSSMFSHSLSVIDYCLSSVWSFEYYVEAFDESFHFYV